MFMGDEKDLRREENLRAYQRRFRRVTSATRLDTSRRIVHFERKEEKRGIPSIQSLKE